MAIRYSVGNRQARPFALWGFTLPPPLPHPPLPPVYLPTAGASLAEAMMDEVIVGTGDQDDVMTPYARKTSIYRMSKKLPATARGVWTGGISDCMVVCAAYYDETRSIWEKFIFQHVQGGQYERIVPTIKADINENKEDWLKPTGRYAVIAAGVGSGTDSIASELDAIGIAQNNIRIYVSGTGSRGFAFGADFSTGFFGEVTHSGTVLPPNWQW
jgi:hypothetical protein